MAKPPIIRTNKPLPFGELSPLEFERLCLWLVAREGYLRAEHLGESGSEQGRDVIAYKATDASEQLWYFQCKRYQKIGAATFIAEVDKYNILAAADPADKPAGIVFVTSATLSAAARKLVREHCAKHGYEAVFWARTELDGLVNKHPDMVEKFFGLVAAPAIEALHQLPSPPADFTGRKQEIRELLKQVGKKGVSISGLQGLGGIGKTALALKFAEHIVHRYPDAQFYLDLKGASSQPLSSAEAQAHIIRAYHPTARLPEDKAELNGLYRSVLHGKRALLLMDNAASSEQIAPLAPPAGCTLIVTSRFHFTLPGLFAKRLDTLPAADAHKLLLQIAPRLGEAVGRIAALCGYLPLALRLAASALAVQINLAPAAYVQRLEKASTRLSLIEASLSLSYDLLSEARQAQWRRLAVFPASFDAAAAAAVWSVDGEVAEDALGELIRYSLVDYDVSTSRYRLHDLARVFAEARLSEDERSKAQRQHAAHYLEMLSGCGDIYEQGGENVTRELALFDLEWDNIKAGQGWAVSRLQTDEEARRMGNEYPRAGAYLFELRQHPRERIAWLEAALEAARLLKARRLEGVHLGNLGIAYKILGETRRAIEFFEQALIINREIGDRRGEGNALGNLGVTFNTLGETRRAVEFLEQALIINREIGNQRGEGGVLGSLGMVYAELGEPRRAMGFCEQHLAITREIGDRRGEGMALGNLGNVYAALGETQRAIPYYEQQFLIAREVGDRLGQARALNNMSLTLHQLGQQEQAIDYIEAAIAIYEQIESPHSARARKKLAEWRNFARPGFIARLRKALQRVKHWRRGAIPHPSKPD